MHILSILASSQVNSLAQVFLVEMLKNAIGVFVTRMVAILILSEQVLRISTVLDQHSKLIPPVLSQLSLNSSLQMELIGRILLKYAGNLSKMAVLLIILKHNFKVQTNNFHQLLMICVPLQRIFSKILMIISLRVP